MVPKSPLRGIVSILSCSLLVLLPRHAHADPNTIDFATYFDADMRDAAECAMSVDNGKIVVDPKASNPAMSCPDMLSWKLFAEVTKERWWTNWASDPQTWPGEPLKLCTGNATGTDCCQPDAANNPGYGDTTTNKDYPNSLHCPYFPGDHLAPATAAVAAPPVARRLGQPIGAHAIFLGQGGLGAALMNALPRAGEPEPGRVIRQEVGEITVRNKPMFDAIFRGNLYNQQGIAAVFNRNRDNLASNAPYQATNGPANMSRIDLPIPAIMIKSNWLYEPFAKELGLTDDPSAPYIKKEMVSTAFGKEYKGIHWLVSFHISTKDIPQWVWTTFEHVNNPGRCDFIGCNDSYGFASSDARPNPAATLNNFTRPHVRNDGLGSSSVIFELGTRYSSGAASRELAAVLDAMGIGTSATAKADPEPTDKAWRSYRLKGSQVSFTNAMGRATRLGNSVTEGGFMTTSSCISCHARAAMKSTGNDASPLAPALGVFSFDQLSEVGYEQSVFGTPHPDWYHGSGSRPALQAMQTDFMWGMPFFAKPLSK
jgi:hypothetical protein